MTYYQVLEIDKKASEEEIKKAYRQMAMKWHPDKNPGDKEAEERFKEISAAYEILGDPTKKKEYDYRLAFGNGINGENLNGLGGVFGAFYGIKNPFYGQQESPRNIDVQMYVDIYTVAHGKKRDFAVNIEESCSTCLGSGKSANSKPRICLRCGGTGQISRANGFMITNSKCTECNGDGEKYEKCPTCNGKKVKQKEKRFSIDIPCGIRSGMMMTLKGQGNYCSSLNSKNDINVHIKIQPNNFFEVKNEDVYISMPVTFKQAILGDSMYISSLYGNVLFSIPPETKNGAIFKLDGLGLPIAPKSSIKGNMYVRVFVDIPKGVSESIKEIIKNIPEDGLKYENVELYNKINSSVNKELEEFKKQ